MRAPFTADRERVQTIKKLVDNGYLRQLLVTNDLCFNSMTHRYGGWGHDHILTNIYPMLDYGLTEANIDCIMKENPARFLDKP